MIAHVFACDASASAGTPTVYVGTPAAPITPCPSTSRAARAVDVLRTVAGRDGWVLLPDGRHLCPFHAQQQAGAAS